MAIDRDKLYICVDVDLVRNERVLNLEEPLACLGLWQVMTSYARESLTDGMVPKRYAETLFGDTKNVSRLADMVQVGLIAEHEKHYEVLRYAPRNQTRAMVEESRKSARERSAKHRSIGKKGTKRTSKKSDNQSRHDAITSECDSVTRDSHDANAEKTCDPMSTRGRARASSLLSSFSSDLEVIVDSDVLGSDLEILSVTARELAASEVTPSDDKRSESEPYAFQVRQNEINFSGPEWIRVFEENMARATGVPCSVSPSSARVLGRILEKLCPKEKRSNFSTWLGEETFRFGSVWKNDTTFLRGGLSPEGLERWLSEGRKSPISHPGTSNGQVNPLGPNRKNKDGSYTQMGGAERVIKMFEDKIAESRRK